MNRKMMLAAGVIAALGLGSPAQAQQTPPEGGTPKDFELPTAQRFTLDNGLEVTMVPYGKVPKVNVSLVIRTGNIDEAADEVWLSDMMGDLLQEGTTTRSSEQVAQEAAAMGGSVNVGVGLDQTTISGVVLSEYGTDLVELLGDVTLNPAFPASELDRLKADRKRQVSIAKTRAQSVTMEQFRKTMYPDHAYGRIFPTEEMIDSYTVERISAFYDENLGAARARIYISGQYDPDAMRDAIEAAFGDWKEGTPPTIDIPEPVTGRAVYLLDRPGAPQSTIYLGIPTTDPSSEDYVAVQVMNSLLGGSFASRITSNIREDKGYTYSPFSQVSVRYRDGYWAETADVTTEVTGAALDEIFYEIERLRGEPPSAEELEGIQNYMAGIFVIQNSSRSGVAGQLSFVDLHGLGDDYLASYVEKIHAVTPEDVQRMAQKYLNPDDMLLVITGDQEVIADQLEKFGTPELVAEE